MKLLKFALYALLFSSLNYIAFSQENEDETETPNKGKISGTVLDADSLTTMIGAKVALVRLKDNTTATGKLTDKKGHFSINNIEFGSYYLKIVYIGYRETEVKPIVFSEKKHVFNLKTIKLNSKDVSSGEVEVTAQKQMIETGLDRKIINVEKNFAATSGGSATDVLRTVPAVTVDIDGNVALRGSNNVKILVDGKPSQLSSSDLLEMIPASSIDNVELITNPSAKFDPEGNAGIININLKKENQNGANGMFSLNAGTGDKYNGSANVNYKTGDFNFFSSLNLRYFSMKGYEVDNKQYRDITSFFRNEDYTRHGGFNNFKIGTDWDINKSNKITVSALLNKGGRVEVQNALNNSYLGFQPVNRDNTLSYDQFLTNKFDRRDSNGFTNRSIDYSLNYKLNFGKKNHDLTADLFYSPAHREFNSNYSQNFYDVDTITHTNQLSTRPDSLQQSRSNFDAYTVSFQSDYNLPMDDGSVFGTGIKYQKRNNDADYTLTYLSSNSWLKDTSSNHFVYDDVTYAGYLTYSGLFKVINYQLGLRGEYTEVKGNLVNNNSHFTDNYFSLFPTVHLKWEMITLHSLQLSYTRRINRPSPRDLNPFINYEDPRNLESGNSNLHPEFAN